MKWLSVVRGSPFAFPLAALTALAMFFISETSYQQATESLDGLGKMGSVRTTIQTIWRNLVDAETGQRGYLLTGRDEYLKPYSEALVSMRRELDDLALYYAKDPAGLASLARVEVLTSEKLSELATTLALYRDGREEAWRDLLLSDIGREKMDLARVSIERLLALESDKVAVGRKGVYQTLLLNRIGVSAMTALSLLALFMYLRQTTALVRQRESQKRELQAERDQLETEVARRTQQLTDLAKHLQNVREDERNHLARELHDELGALLTSAKLDVARLKSRLGAMTPEVADRIKHLIEALNGGIALKRRIIEDLRPSSLSNLGLVAALDILVKGFDERFEGRIVTELEPVSLTPSGDLTVYRLVQEALTNIAKYAQAKTIRIELRTESSQVHVAVTDDGVGFDTARVRSTAHGLLGMHYRVEAEGGRMTLDSTPGSGTRIEVLLPERIAPVEQTEPVSS